MRKLASVLGIIVASSLLNGCALYRLEELRRTEPTGNSYQKELAHLYLEFATEEEKAYDWYSSIYFAGKGLEAAYGKDVAPEMPEDWNIPADKLSELQAAREKLMAVMTPDIMKQEPTRLANAQFYFDCWVEQQQENWQTDDIEFCRDSMHEAMDALHATRIIPQDTAEAYKAKQVVRKPVRVAVAKSESKPMAKKEPEPETTKPVLLDEKPVEKQPEPMAADMEKPAEPVMEKAVEKSAEPAAKTPESPVEKALDSSVSKALGKAAEKPAEKTAAAAVANTGASDTISYAVFFESGKAELSTSGKSVIDEVVRSAKAATDYEVVLLGSADKNTGLSAQRAEAVKTTLAASGLKESAISVVSGKMPETKPGVRRIEIFLNE